MKSCHHCQTEARDLARHCSACGKQFVLTESMKTAWRRIAIAYFAILLIVILSGSFYLYQRFGQTVRLSNSIHAGEDAVISAPELESVILAVRREDQDMLASFLIAKNISAATRMVTDGKAILVSNQIRVTVLENDWNYFRVEIREGSHRGDSGWIPRDWLR